jgi:hypothetical protein
MRAPLCWNLSVGPEFGFLSTLNEAIRQMQERNPHLLPNIQRGATITVTSDYSGGRKAGYQVLSFLFADFDQAADWEAARWQVREKYLTRGRVMAYKSLGERFRGEALTPFLGAANRLPGLSLTVAIHQSIKTIFFAGDFLNRGDARLTAYADWSEETLEKMFRVVHLIALFVAGLSRPQQNVLWITDEDEIGANSKRLDDLKMTFATVARYYLTHELGGLRCTTTAADDATRLFEDLAAIPDLCAGAMLDYLTTPRAAIGKGTPNAGIKAKSRPILYWLGDHRQPLKRLVCEMALSNDGRRILMKWPRHLVTS